MLAVGSRANGCHPCALQKGTLPAVFGSQGNPMITSSDEMRYREVCAQADSIRSCPDNGCQIIAGSNDGYFIEAFGKSYRFACVTDPIDLAVMFTDIVNYHLVLEETR
jgi:hypothetical protein